MIVSFGGIFDKLKEVSELLEDQVTSHQRLTEFTTIEREFDPVEFQNMMSSIESNQCRLQEFYRSFNKTLGTADQPWEESKTTEMGKSIHYIEQLQAAQEKALERLHKICNDKLLQVE